MDSYHYNNEPKQDLSRGVDIYLIDIPRTLSHCPVRLLAMIANYHRQISLHRRVALVIPLSSGSEADGPLSKVLGSRSCRGGAFRLVTSTCCLCGTICLSTIIVCG
jgi:hypothetical protein